MNKEFDEAFEALQKRMVPMWPGMTVRTVQNMRRAVLVVSSISIDVPSIAPVLPAYEERYLFMVRALAQSPGTRVVYVTSQPILPTLVDYYLGMAGGSEAEDLRSRVFVVAVCDGSATPLSRKILERPRLLARIRSLLDGYEHKLLLPFMVTSLEAELAVQLDVPLYGPAPHLTHLGTKTGSREIFAAASIPAPRGVTGVRRRGDVVEAIRSLEAEGPSRRYVVKTDVGVGGLGNAIVDVAGHDAGDVEPAVDALTPVDHGQTSTDFFDALGAVGGVVEQWLDGDEVASPSVQLRASPLCEVEVLSTHDQVLGGEGGCEFLGCRFPAARPFIPILTAHGRAIGEELARRGVVGRFAVDFVLVRTGETWRPYAVEINLRNGGTTHPTLTLLGLTNGSYDEDSGELVTRTGPKYYVATDHLQRPEYRQLTPDDVIELVAASGLGWDDTTQTGAALHMLSAVAVAGRLGATAIGSSPEQAQSIYTGLWDCLDAAVGRPAP